MKSVFYFLVGCRGSQRTALHLTFDKCISYLKSATKKYIYSVAGAVDKKAVEPNSFHAILWRVLKDWTDSHCAGVSFQPDCNNYAVFNCEPLNVSWGANHLNFGCLCHNRFAEPRLPRSSYYYSAFLFIHESRTFRQETWPGYQIRFSHKHKKNIWQCKAIAYWQSVCVWACIHIVHLCKYPVYAYEELIRESITAH